MNKKQNRGITLVALVITIIVLIILAGVSITAVMNGGLITNAKDAKNEYTQAKEKEEKTLSQLEIEETEIEFLKEGIPYRYKKEYITGINVGTTVKEMLDQFPEDEGYAIYYNSDATEPKNDGDIITTGYVLKKGEDEVGTIIIFGELNGDGAINVSDTLLLGIELRNGTQLADYYLVAADVNHDGVVNYNDMKLLDLHTTNNVINQNAYAIRAEDLVIEDGNYVRQIYMNKLTNEFKSSNYYFEVRDEEGYVLKQKTTETITASQLLSLLPEGSKVLRGSRNTFDKTSTEIVVSDDDLIYDWGTGTYTIGNIEF